jgi:hypothetical protein
MLQQVDIDRNALSEPVRLLLDELTLKHNKLQYCLIVSAVQDSRNPDFWDLVFHDPRFTNDEAKPVGAVSWSWGSRNDKEYRTKSRLIQNDRFGAWNRDEFHSKRIKDVKKTIKNVLEFVKPYEWHELVTEERNNALRASSKWRDENDSIQYSFRPNAKEVVEEILHLMNLNVPFKTQAFKNMISKLPEWEENERRRSVVNKFDSIIFHRDKVIFVTHDGQQSELPSVDALPEKHRNAIALLKIMGEEQHIPEVGYKGKHQKYFIYA